MPCSDESRAADFLSAAVGIAERYREIGLRKALGATDRSLVLQTLLESIAICSAAGVLGFLSGFAVYELAIYGGSRVIDTLQVEWVIDQQAVFISVLAIFAVGVISGIAPSLRAKRLQVMDAMRSE